MTYSALWEMGEVIHIVLSFIIEVGILTGCLYMGAKITKVDGSLKEFVLIALIASAISPLPYVGIYLSAGVMLFLIMKWARTDYTSALFMVVVGKGLGLVILIYGWSYLNDMEQDAWAEENYAEEEFEEEIPEAPPPEPEKKKLNPTSGPIAKTIQTVDKVESKAVEGMPDAVMADSQAPEPAPQQVKKKKEAKPVVAATPPPVPAMEEEAPEPVVEEDGVVRQTPYEMDIPVYGKLFPYKVVAPEGWSALEGLADYALSPEEGIRLHFYAGYNGIDPNTYATEEVARIKSDYPHVSLMKQEIVKVDGLSWGHFNFRGEGDAMNGADINEVILLTHASERGRYSMMVTGDHDAIVSRQGEISKVISSFRFPPDNVDTSDPSTPKVRISY